jgi:phage/conjugal plasmid C-4 type zinc finger TraR family protein
MNDASLLCLGGLVLFVAATTDWKAVREIALDEVDFSAERDFRLDALMKARPTARLERPALSNFCCDCGEEIPAARRKVVENCRRCVDCQTELEARG